jgi:ribosomal protein S18 acetylase RimI-like enzyme
MMRVRISPGRGSVADEDRAFVRELGRRCVIASVGSVRHAPEGLVREAFDRLCEIVWAQSHVTLIAERDDSRAGFLLLLDELPDEVTLLPQAFVAYMAVEPDCRCAGMGAALLAAAEDEAQRRRRPFIALMVTEENAAARALYDCAGYITERRLLCKAL